MFDHFGLLAPIYEKFIRASHPEALDELAELAIGGPLLDVGGGTGRVSQFLIDRAQPVVIADLSLKMLRQTQLKHDLRPVCSHSEKLPFPDDYFERVIMVDALHHVCDQQQTADELWRVVKPGGRIIIEEPDINRGLVKLVALGEKIALMRSHFLSPPEIVMLFAPYPTQPVIHPDGHIVRIVIDKSP